MKIKMTQNLFTMRKGKKKYDIAKNKVSNVWVMTL